MKKTLISASLTLIPALLIGCAAGDDGAGPSDEMDLRTAGIASMEINVGTGFVPPPPPGGCNSFGRYAVDFNSKKLTGNGCVDNAQVNVDRKLTTAELASVRAAVAGVRTLQRPDSCPTDIPTIALTVKRSSGTTTRYLDELSACGPGGATAVTRGSVGALMSVVEGLAVNAQSFEGSLQHVVAIGGETTGRIIRTEAGSFELDFAAESDLSAEFVSGQKARVSGVREDRPGVEIAMRHFIKVKDMLVCPAPAAVQNCMPPTEAKACVPANRTWISANCDNVQFVD